MLLQIETKNFGTVYVYEIGKTANWFWGGLLDIWLYHADMLLSQS